MKNFITIIACITIGFAACKKNNTAPPPAPGTGTYADFLKNTEWVGTLHRSGYQYAPPTCLKFRADNSMVMYAPFYFNVGGIFQRPDSIIGTITGIDSLADGTTSVKARFDFYNDLTLFITGRKTLAASSANAGNPVPFRLELFPRSGFTVSGIWSGPVITDPGPANGRLAYPDLSTIEFNSSRKVTTYYRNGLQVLAQPTPQFPVPGALEISYNQYGAMLFMKGYNEVGIKLYDYFGVLLPAGNKMMVHSSAQGARLPYYTQTIPWDGPIGVTPVINKQ